MCGFSGAEIPASYLPGNTNAVSKRRMRCIFRLQKVQALCLVPNVSFQQSFPLVVENDTFTLQHFPLYVGSSECESGRCSSLAVYHPMTGNDSRLGIAVQRITYGAGCTRISAKQCNLPVSSKFSLRNLLDNRIHFLVKIHSHSILCRKLNPADKAISAGGISPLNVSAVRISRIERQKYIQFLSQNRFGLIVDLEPDHLAPD